MEYRTMKTKLHDWKATLAAGFTALALVPAFGHHTNETISGYQQVNLVSDVASNAPATDPRLVNPWGILVGEEAVWVNDNGPGLTTAYGPFGQIFDFAINIPSPVATNTGTPSGLVFNPTRHFVFTNGTSQAPATFLMATEDGTITAWNHDVNESNAVIVVDNSASNAVYKGLAIARLTNGAPQLYAANFHAGVVDVFDAQFNYVQSFTDTSAPTNFAPFNIKNINGQLFVTFALQKLPDMHDDQAGPSNGVIDVFAPDGTMVRQFASQGALNSPWGMAVAPGGFGEFAHALLVGNFGDGFINAFDLETGNPLGHLTNADGSDLVISNLWGLAFAEEAPADRNDHEDEGGDGDDAHNGHHGHEKRGHHGNPGHPEFGREGPRLYFTAGINGEADGLFGYVVRVPGPRSQRHD
jgi:uncharacterized protein (TIGR03118 family)